MRISSNCDAANYLEILFPKRTERSFPNIDVIEVIDNQNEVILQSRQRLGNTVRLVFLAVWSVEKEDVCFRIEALKINESKVTL